LLPDHHGERHGTAADILGDRLACRTDNAHVPAAQRIDCTDPVARESRPKVINR
jgi:hypothetical protein